MRDKLPADLFGMFDELFCATTDDEAVELFVAIKDKADTIQLLELFAMLDPNQVEYYERVSEAVTKVSGEDDA
jgi:hypothetical protein